MQFNTTALPRGNVGKVYLANLVATGGTPPYTYTVVGGSQPVGVALSSPTGVISGQPTAAGLHSVTYKVTDSLGATSTVTLPIVISSAPSIPPGISLPAIGTIPAEWSASWFASFVQGYLQNADVRNATGGTGIVVGTDPTTGPGATISLSAEMGNLFGEPYLVYQGPPDASLTNYNILVGQAGVLSLASGAATGNATLSVVANGIGNTQLRQGGALTVIGNATNATANVADLSQAQLTALINSFTSSLSGAAPASGGGTTNFLRADGGWDAPPGTASSANPSVSIGLTATDGTAPTFMTSDSAPALSQAIAPTWTGAHVFTPSSAVTAATLNAAANAVGVQINGGTNTVNKYLLRLLSGTGSGFSSGLYIQAGTTSADAALVVNNAAATLNYFLINGDGSGSLGASGSAGLQWTSTGNVTISPQALVGKAATDKVAFYGVTPIVQRATTSTQKTSNLATATTSASFGTVDANDFNAAVHALQEVMNTLAAYGLWGTS